MEFKVRHSTHQWQSWFAWHPIWIKGGDINGTWETFVWLQKVERRKEVRMGDDPGPSPSLYTYRKI